MPIKDKNGNWINSRGNPMPPIAIDPVVRKEDVKTFSLMRKAVKVYRQLSELVTVVNQTIDDLSNFAQTNGKTIVSKNGYITISDYRHNFRIEVNSQDITDFNSILLQAAKQKFDRCLQKWSEGSRPELVLLVQNAFDVDKKGNINKSKLFDLLAITIQDPDWIAAREDLSSAIFTDRTKTYRRFYIRDQKRKWHYLPLDFSKIDESSDHLFQVIDLHFPKRRRPRNDNSQ